MALELDPEVLAVRLAVPEDKVQTFSYKDNHASWGVTVLSGVDLGVYLRHLNFQVGDGQLIIPTYNSNRPEYMKTIRGADIVRPRLIITDGEFYGLRDFRNVAVTYDTTYLSWVGTRPLNDGLSDGNIFLRAEMTAQELRQLAHDNQVSRAHIRFAVDPNH